MVNELFVALFDFEGINEEDELSFKKNDLLFVERDSGGWAFATVKKGAHLGKKGWIPMNFVAKEKDKKKDDKKANKLAKKGMDPNLQENKINAEYRALFDFAGVDETELTFSAGEVLYVDYEVSGWFYAKNSKGAQGFAPMNFLTVAAVNRTTSSPSASLPKTHEVNKSYDAKKVGELDVKKGDVVHLHQALGDGSAYVTLIQTGTCGYLPQKILSAIK